MISLDAFWDELNNIAISSPHESLTKAALAIPKKIPSYVKYPAAGVAAILGWEGLKKLKRQRDLGAAMEEQMGQQE